MTILGKKGSGKSFLTREIAHDFDRVIVLDSMGEYGPREGFMPLIGLDEALAHLPLLAGKPDYAVSVRVLNADDAMDVLSIVYELPGTFLIVEETSLYCSPSYLPDELAQLIRYGRHRSISMAFVARRPSELHRDITAQSDLVISFRQHETRDVQYLKGTLGDRAELLRDLPLYAIAVYGDMEKAPASVLERMEKSPKNVQIDLFDKGRPQA